MFLLGLVESRYQASRIVSQCAACWFTLDQRRAPGAIDRIDRIPSCLVAHFHRLGGLRDGAGFGNALQELDPAAAQKISAVQCKPEAAVNFELG